MVFLTRLINIKCLGDYVVIKNKIIATVTIVITQLVNPLSQLIKANLQE